MMVSHWSIFRSIILSLSVVIVAPEIDLTAVLPFNSFVLMFFSIELPIKRVDCFMVFQCE